MSYHVWIERDLDGHPHRVAECGNYTSNVGSMWIRALGLGITLGETIERYPTTDELAPHLRQAIAAMINDPAAYEELNPSNGWGDYSGALAYLQRIEQACRLHPGARVMVWR
jgi:hypothetical protein